MAATINGPQLVQITKKTANNTYTLYYPQTDSSYVLHYTQHPTDPDFADLVRYDAKGNADQSGSYFHVNDLLNVVFDKIGSVSHVLEFKGVKSTYAGLGQASADTVGDVYVVNEAHGTYPAGTLYVGSVDNTTTPITYSWQPLGGNNTIYATKAEALSSVSLNGPTLSFAYADNSTQNTHITSVTFSTIGTAAASTVGITTSISSDTSTAIPTEGAVYNFASSAGQVKVTAAAEGYLIGVASYSDSDSSTAKAPLDFKIHVTNGKTNTPTLGANISGKAATAGTSDKVKASLTVAGQSFDGSAAKTISVGNGLTTTTSGNTTTISVGEGDGITVDANGISVNAGNGLAYSNNQIVAKATAGLTVTASGIGISNTVASGVYSAVAVNQYGLATAGAQSIIFAKGLNDPDLGDLVVGGLAFIGTSTAAASTYTGNAASTGTIGVMDDAE